MSYLWDLRTNLWTQADARPHAGQHDVRREVRLQRPLLRGRHERKEDENEEADQLSSEVQGQLSPRDVTATVHGERGPVIFFCGYYPQLLWVIALKRFPRIRVALKRFGRRRRRNRYT